MNRYSNAKSRLILGFWLVVVFGNSALAQSPNASRKDPIVGGWRVVGYGGGPLLLQYHPEGTVHASNGSSGTWRSIPSASEEQKYEVTWGNGLFVDHITLSPDGEKYRGKNGSNRNLSAERITDPRPTVFSRTDPILGKWLQFWDGGGPFVVELQGDGTMVCAKATAGTWKCSDWESAERKYEFVWNNGFVDHLTLSADAAKYKGNNS